jgi:hypothetical protein
VEASLAELEIGRMLYVHDYKFQFNERQAVKRRDYDLEIQLDRWSVCADVKCKLEITPITATTIISTLEKGRAQLPDNRPGILFVKVPQKWSNRYLYPQLIADSTRRFFMRGSGRIASVKFYMASLEMGENGYISQTHKFMEIANPRNRFDRDRSWELFTRRASTGIPPAMATAMPSKWLRLQNFPDSLKDYEVG